METVYLYITQKQTFMPDLERNLYYYQALATGMYVKDLVVNGVQYGGDGITPQSLQANHGTIFSVRPCQVTNKETLVVDMDQSPNQPSKLKYNYNNGSETETADPVGPYCCDDPDTW